MPSYSHVLEELQHQINTKKREEMTDQELQFHYFKLHDFDNNNLLDGLEIIKALTHAHDEAGWCSFHLFVLVSTVPPMLWCCFLLINSIAQIIKIRGSKLYV